LEMIDNKEKPVQRGKHSRRKKVLIEQAIKNCKPEDRYNRYKICEQLSYLIEDSYDGKEKNIQYHSERMGLDTTLKMLKEIDDYFYRDFKVN